MFSLSHFLQKADIVIRAKLSHAGTQQTGASCKHRNRSFVNYPRKRPGWPPGASACVFDKEKRLRWGLVIHLWNPLGVNVSPFDWPLALPLLRQRKGHKVESTYRLFEPVLLLIQSKSVAFRKSRVVVSARHRPPVDVRPV